MSKPLEPKQKSYQVRKYYYFPESQESDTAKKAEPLTKAQNASSNRATTSPSSPRPHRPSHGQITPSTSDKDRSRNVSYQLKMTVIQKINPLPFYAEWAGHPLSDLATVHSAIQAIRPNKPIVYLAGDSSLDNKAWVPSNGPAGQPLPEAVPEIYKSFFPAPNGTGLTGLKPDVAFFLNHALGSKASVINAAVEASLLRQREKSLLPHDEFIRDHISAKDVLIVSVGANDIALSPTPATIRHMLQLAWVTPKSSLEKGTASSLQHFRQMFGAQTQTYIAQLTSKQKPRAVVVCAIYYPLEASATTQTSWADGQLKMLGYGMYPGQLQAAIRQIYASATAKMQVEGTKVVPCALYEVMDGKREGDYVARVEPSVDGGRKMAGLLREKVEEVLGTV